LRAVGALSHFRSWSQGVWSQGAMKAVTVTVSIGVAAIDRSRTLAVADLLAAADVCTYRRERPVATGS
jgi:GGDEF domain-containing protein